jgi:hypothetical protein
MKKTIPWVLFVVLGFAAFSWGAEFSADIMMETGGMKNAGKVFMKNLQVYRNEIMGIVSIGNQDSIYQVFTQTRKYTVASIEEMKKNNPMAGAKDLKTFFKQNNLKQTGSEKIGDYACDVYEGSLKFEEGQPPVQMKIWYSSELDYTIRQESEMPSMAGKMVVQLENIKKGKQPDDLFKVPAGYTKVATTEEAMGIQMPQMPENMPTQEDQEKMMKQMQEMMKNMPKN